MSTSPYRYGPLAEHELGALAAIVAHGFGLEEEASRDWLASLGVEQLRGLHQGAALVGGLARLPMGQYFGARSVSTLGVAGVGISPAARGHGAAKELMRSCVQEARQGGFALSTLFPATTTLYQRAGYERAGALYVFSADPRQLQLPAPRGEDAPTLTELTVDWSHGVPEPLGQLYTGMAQQLPGWLERPPCLWRRVGRPRGARPARVLLASFAGKPEGYAALSHTLGLEGWATRVTASDLVASTARAARALLRLCTEYRSVATELVWSGAPYDLFAHLLPERHTQLTLRDYFMLRIAHVPRALEQRGWPLELTGELVLDVADESLPAWSGAYHVRLHAGRAEVRPATSADGAPRAQLHERALAALYTGHTPPRVLASLGWLGAPEHALSRLEAWFAGPAPTLRDQF